MRISERSWKTLVVLTVITVVAASLLAWRFLDSSSRPFQASNATFEDIPEYYDDRTFACTTSWDDFESNTPTYLDMFEIFNSHNLTYTMGVITEHTDTRWTDIQEAFDWAHRNGTTADTPHLMELGSHSRDHGYPTSWDNATAYDQIGGSAKQIKGNVTLDGSFWATNGKEYVLAWIEPWGGHSSYTRRACGDYHYLTDRDTFGGSAETSWKLWDTTNGLYEVWGAYYDADRVSNTTLKKGFDWCYNNSKIFNTYGHPSNPRHDWDNPENYTANWVEHISGNTSCWYAHHGTLYSYHFLETNQSGVLRIMDLGNNEFQITIDGTLHKRYGFVYPVTYEFNISSTWTNVNVQYRYKQDRAWKNLPTRTSSDFFNGISVSRFDFNNSKAYVSIGFSGLSDHILLRITGKSSNTEHVVPKHSIHSMIWLPSVLDFARTPRKCVARY